MPDLLREVTGRIVHAFHPQKIVRFGSYAHGVPRAESDVDLLVIMESQERPAQRMARVAGVRTLRLSRHPLMGKAAQRLLRSRQAA